MNRKSIQRYTNTLAKIIYPTFVRPHLEFASATWPVIKKCHIKILEAVQRRATRTYELKNNDYEKRLESLGWMPIKARRLRGDLIQTYRLYHGMDKASLSVRFFTGATISENINTRSAASGAHITCEPASKCTTRHNFLLNRVSSHWNKLPPEVIRAKDLTSFKIGIDKKFKADKQRTTIYKS